MGEGISTLREATQELLKNRPRHRTLEAIAIEANVPFSWLKLFAAAKHTGPSVDRVQAVYEVLAGRKLI
jgi:hypothetical protein